MMKIPLTRNRVAIVDDADYPVLSQFKWCVSSNGYVHRRASETDDAQSIVRMHHMLLPAVSGMDVDHKNRNKLDNRRRNLRYLTRSQNMLNTGLKSNNSSGHKGVTWHKASGKWSAQIMVNYRQQYLGLFETVEAGIKARKDAERGLLP